MARMALIAYPNYHGIKKIAVEMMKLGWIVDIFDPHRLTKSNATLGEAKFDFILAITAHLPAGVGAKLREYARQTRTTVVDSPPTWSIISMRLAERKLLTPPVGAAPADGELKHRPFEKLKDQPVAEEPKTEPQAPVPTQSQVANEASPKAEESTVPANVQAAVKARQQSMQEKLDFAETAWRKDPFKRVSAMQVVLKAVFGSACSHEHLAPVQAKVWKEKGITEYPKGQQPREKHQHPRTRTKADPVTTTTHSAIGTEALKKKMSAFNELVEEFMREHGITVYSASISGEQFGYSAKRSVMVTEDISGSINDE